MVAPVNLAWGMEIVEDWAIDAAQAERNMVYEALLTMVDGTAAARYDMTSLHGRFCLVISDDLVIQGRFEDDAFGVLFVGRAADELPDDSDGLCRRS